MLTGKHWLLTSQGVVDVSASEHAIYARSRMLRLPIGDGTCHYGNMFSALTPSEVGRYRRRGVSKRVLRFLSQEGADPRVYAIRHWRWIRTRGCRFYLWQLDDRTLRVIRNAEEYWKAQTGLGRHDMVDVVELATGREFAVAVRKLRDRRALAAKRSSG